MVEDYMISFYLGRFFKDRKQGTYKEISDFLKSKGLAHREDEFQEKLNYHVEAKRLSYDETEKIYKEIR